MTRIILVRPGRTDYDDQQRIQGSLDVPLNDAGRDEAVEAAEGLDGRDVRCIYCSHCSNAAASADLMAEQLGVPVRKVDSLRNVDHGLWQGMLVSEVRRKYRKAHRQWTESPMTVCPPGGEMLSQAFARVSQWLRRLVRRHRSETVALVCPEPLASVVRCAIRNGRPDKVWEYGSSNGACELLDVMQWVA